MAKQALWSLLEDDQFELVDLAQRAKTARGKKREAKLVCDYASVSSWLYRSLDDCLQEQRLLTSYSVVCGGDLREYAKRMQSFVVALRHLHIEPVFFVDGPVGSDRRSLLNRFDTFITRHMQRIEEHSAVERFCEGLSELSDGIQTVNPSMYFQGLKTLEESKVEMKFCLGLADYDIGLYTESNENILGVLSSNTDFAIMKSGKLIHVNSFDIVNNSLCLNKKEICLKPTSLKCYRASRQTISASLGIQESSVVDLSFLCGNDFMANLHDYSCLLKALEIKNDSSREKNSHVASIARWFKKEKVASLKECLAFQELCDAKPHIGEMYESSYTFYELTAPPKSGNPQMDYALSQVRAGKLNHFCAVVNSGILWHHDPLQSVTLGSTPASQSTLPLRKLAYGILGLHTVLEYGQSDKKPLEKFLVKVHNAESGGDSLLKWISKCSEHEQLQLFFKSIVQFPDEFIEAKSLKDMFSKVKSDLSESSSLKGSYVTTSAALLFFYNYCTLSKAVVSDSIFETILVTVLLCMADIPPVKCGLRPTTEAVMVSSLLSYVFQMIDVIADLFCLHDVVPQPKDVFYPLAFIPYHLASHQQDNPHLQEPYRILSKVKAMEAVSKLYQSLKFSQLKLTLLSSEFECAVNEVKFHKKILTCTRRLTPGSNLLLSSNFDTDDTFEIEEKRDNQKVSPVCENRERILEYIKSYQVSCIVGETGSGKTTKVPPLLLRDLRRIYRSQLNKKCAVLVCQPTRIAAVNAAKYVELHLDEKVGLLVTIPDMRYPMNPLTFCTYDCLCELLLKYRRVLEDLHYLILDEVHERSIREDFAMMIVRRQLSNTVDSQLKIVLMSATMQSTLFVGYFQRALGLKTVAVEPFHVGIRREKIEEYYMENLENFVEKSTANHFKSDDKEMKTLRQLLKKHEGFKFERPGLNNFIKKLCARLIVFFIKPGESIMIFVAGLKAMIELSNDLNKYFWEHDVDHQFKVHVLHRLVPFEDQMEAIKHPPPSQANVIIASGHAQHSLTISSLKLVINLGHRKSADYDVHKRKTCIVTHWCSQAACIQRAGRVGRVAPGTVIHLFPKALYKQVFPLYEPAEMHTSSLAQVVLLAKHVGSLFSIASPSEFLSEVIQPPSVYQMKTALEDLYEMGAICSSSGVVKESDPMTNFGKFCFEIPSLDLDLIRLVFFGLHFNCIADAIVMACALSLEQEAFSMPSYIVIKNEREFIESLQRSNACRFAYDAGANSCLIMVTRLYQDWLKYRAENGDARSIHEAARWFSFEVISKTSVARAVRPQKLLDLHALVCAISHSLHDNPELSTDVSHRLSALSGRNFRNYHKAKFTDDTKLLQALIVAAFVNKTLVGQCRIHSDNDMVKSGAERMIELIDNNGLDYKRTLVIDKLDSKKVTIDDVNEMVETVVKGCSTRIEFEDDTALIEFKKQGETRQSTSENSSVLMNEMLPMAAYMLYQFPESSKSWSTEELRKSSVSFTRPCHPFQRIWSELQNTSISVDLYEWRNPSSFVCDLNKEFAKYPLLAVARTLHGSHHSYYTAMADSLTILPHVLTGPLTPLVMLAFQPLTSCVCIQVDTVTKQVCSIIIEDKNVPLGPTCLSLDDIHRVNELRVAMCTIFNNEAPSLSISRLLHNVLHRCGELKVVSDSNKTLVAKDTFESDEDSSVASDWENAFSSSDSEEVKSKLLPMKGMVCYTAHQELSTEVAEFKKTVTLVPDANCDNEIDIDNDSPTSTSQEMNPFYPAYVVRSSKIESSVSPEIRSDCCLPKSDKAPMKILTSQFKDSLEFESSDEDFASKDIDRRIKSRSSTDNGSTRRETDKGATAEGSFDGRAAIISRGGNDKGVTVEGSFGGRGTDIYRGGIDREVFEMDLFGVEATVEKGFGGTATGRGGTNGKATGRGGTNRRATGRGGTDGSATVSIGFGRGSASGRGVTGRGGARRRGPRPAQGGDSDRVRKGNISNRERKKRRDS